MASYTVIIPSKTSRNLSACLAHIYRNEPDADVIVMDDGLDFQCPGPRYLDGLKPFVFANNCNIGIQQCTGDIVLLNDDALLTTPRGFSLLSEVSETNTEYGIIGPSTNVTGQLLQRPSGNKGLRQIPVIPFICVYIRRAILNQCGLLDERYSVDYGVEDNDYCETVHRAGYKIGVYDPVFIDHGSLRSSFRGEPRRPLGFAGNAELFRQKWGLSLTEAAARHV